MSGYVSTGYALRIVLCAFPLLSSPSVAHAQRLADLPNGTQLRLRADGEARWQQGTFAGVRAGGLAFVDSGRVFVVPRHEIRTLEWHDVDTQRSVHVMRAGLIGAGVSLAVMALLAHTGDLCTGDGCDFVPVSTIPIVAIGFGIGALLRSGEPAEQWRTVDPPLPE